MGFKPITRNMPVEEPPNILSEDDAAIYRGILGQDGVLNIGSKLKTTVLSNNKVRVGDGVINVDGHIGRNSYADYEDLTIENGTAGQKRNDLIIASFSTTGSGGLDTYVLKVKKGVAGSTGTDPAVTKQDIYAGGKLREYPLYRVKLDGLSIVGVEQLFKVIPTVPELETKYNELNSAMKRESFSILPTASEVSTKVKFSSKFNRVPTVVVTPTFQGWRLSKPIQVSNITTDGFTATAWIENGAISSDMWITVEYMAIALGA